MAPSERPRLDHGLVDEIKTRVDALAIFSRFVRLKKAGRRYTGLCPFHKERSPSFGVDPELGLYYCFGCQRGGDVITFLMEMEGQTFWEVVKDMAQEAGVALPERTVEQTAAAGNRERAAQAYAQADEFYRAALNRSEKAIDYLSGRNLTMELARHYGMGYAPEGWGNLRDHLNGLGFNDEELREYGLVTGESGRPYDRFRDRLLFPIRDVKGRAIAFGGRAITPGDEPKYLNSPDSLLYKKSEVLYGLDRARGAMRDKDYAILVEGYMDQLALDRAGFANTVAGCGTALTGEQARLLARYTRRAVLFYDADTAGQNAARKAITLLVPENFQITIATTPGGKDADELLNTGGPEALQECLKNAVPFWPWLLRHLEGQHDLRQPQGREKFLSDAVDLLRQVPGEAARRSLVAPLAEKLAIPEGVVLSELRKRPGEAGGGGFARQALRGSLTPVERMLWHLLLGEPALVRILRDEAEREDLLELLTSPALLAIYGAEEEPDGPAIQKALSDCAGGGALAALAIEDEKQISPLALRKTLSTLRQNRLKYSSRKLDRELQEAIAAGDSPRVNEILQERRQLARKIQE